MRGTHRTPAGRLPVIWLAMLLLILAGCRGRAASDATRNARQPSAGESEPRAMASRAPSLQATALQATGPQGTATAPGTTAAAQAAATVQAEGQAQTGEPTATARANSGQMVEWPEGTFRYEVRWRPAGEPDGPQTVVSGQYRAGTWQQTARTGEAAAEELLTYGGKTYTRPGGEVTWTRWPGLDFDTAYGLASPFTLLRLYQLAGPSGQGTAEPVDGAPEPTVRKQIRMPAGLVTRALGAGVTAIGQSAESRANLAQQVKLAATAQTITFWVGESGRVYGAEATLQVLDMEAGQPAEGGEAVTGQPSSAAAGQPVPWVDITWRFWDYDDQQIAVSVPVDYEEAPGAEMQAAPDLTEPGQTLNANLTVHVFAAPGVPARDLAVTVYAAGTTREPIDWRSEASARFSLPAGRYDVRVQMHYAEEWLRGLEVGPAVRVSRNVTFDFGTLQLAVKRRGEDVPVEIVTYPAGERQSWVDQQSDNPASMQLRAGTYDVDLAYGDERVTETVRGLVVRAGEVTAKTIEVK